MGMRFSSRIRVWLLLGILLHVALLFFPVLWAALFPPEGWSLYRNWTLGDDYTQYRSAMLQGYDGAWLIYNRFTPEPHNPVLQYPFYVFLGQGARVLRLPLEWLYYTAGIVANIVLLWVIGAFSRTFLQKDHEFSIAWLLALASGPGWLIGIVQAFLPACDFCLRYTSAFSRPEINTWLLLTAPPHLPLSLAGMLWLWRDFWQQQTTGFTAKPLIRYALLVIFLALLNPFSLVPALLPLGVWWISASLLARKPLWSLAVPLCVMGLVALPLVIYNYWTFVLDVFWGRAYGSQNLQISLPLDGILWGYGVSSVLAVWAILTYWRRQTGGRFLIVLALVLLLSRYLPVTYQNRFGFGLGPIVAVLAVPAWQWVMHSEVVRQLRQRFAARVVGSFLLIMLFWGQNLAFYAIYASAYLGVGPTARFVFQPQDLASAADYLTTLGPTVIILAQEDTGNILAGQIQGRVVLGHAGATLDVEERREQVAAFFGGRLTKNEQDALLAQWNVTHIVVSSWTDNATIERPMRWPIVFSTADVAIYDVSN